MIRNQLKINEAADVLGVSVDTLRRWDNNGKLKAIRATQGAHRYYSQAQLEEYLISSCIDLASKWAGAHEGKTPADIFYCSDSSVFQGRLYKLRVALSKNSEIESFYSLLISVVGEIGDNSFGHNLGNWPDVIGIFFAFDIDRRTIVLADRGQGIFKTLKRVRPDLQNDAEAMIVAFTEILSGRAPESRGNGLKYVRTVVTDNPMNLSFQSGEAELRLGSKNTKLKIRKAKNPIQGCLAVITF